MIGDKRGLTLMEILVVMGVFSMTVTVTSGIFLLSNQAQRRVLALSTAQSDLRFAMEAIVREVRGGQIDYAAYEGSQGGISLPASRLLLKSASGNDLEFYSDSNPTVCPLGTPSCLAVRVNGVAQSLTSKGVVLDKLVFYVSPGNDPFTIDASSGLYGADAQPTVTIAMQIQTTGPKPQDVFVMNAQTTVTSRVYAR